MQQYKIKADTLKDISETWIKFRLLDKNLDVVNLNSIDIISIEFIGLQQVLKKIPLNFDSIFIYFTENTANSFNGIGEKCDKPIIADFDLSVIVKYTSGGVEKMTKLHKFKPMTDKGKSIDLLEK